jgi:hypothetical protein
MMNAFIVIPFRLIVFFLRDYFLLQMGPVRLLHSRLRLYGLATLASALLVSGGTSRLSDEELLSLDRTAGVVVPITAFYALFVGECLWMRRTNRHDRVWLLAVAPNPLLAFCITLFARLVFSSSSVYVVTAASAIAACVWIGLIRSCLKGTVEASMDVSEIDFSIGIAACVNAIAVVLCAPIF